jgi:hypothetical protein
LAILAISLRSVSCECSHDQFSGSEDYTEEVNNDKFWETYFPEYAMSDCRAFASDLVFEKRQRKQNQKYASEDMTELVDQFWWEHLIVDKQKLPGSGIETPHTLPLC